MSKLDDLIKKFCPNGVKFLKFEEYIDYEQPTRYIVHKEDYNNNYDTPVLTAGQTFILGYSSEKDNIYPASTKNPVIIFDDFTGAFKWVDFPFKVKSSAMKILSPREGIILRYVFHIMGHINFSSSEHKRLWISFYSQLSFPDVPFSYHLFLLSELNDAINNDCIQKYHFNSLRNILEKTSSFLGYHNWGILLDECNREYQSRMINLCSHSKISWEEVPFVKAEEKAMLFDIINFLRETYHFKIKPNLNVVTTPPPPTKD